MSYLDRFYSTPLDITFGSTEEREFITKKIERMKTTSTFIMEFVIWTKKNNSGEAIIYARMNVNKKLLEMSLKKSINAGLWDNAPECIKGNKPEAKQLNKIHFGRF